MAAHPLIGVWNGSAHPMQESSIVFYPDGNGLLFYFMGSLGARLGEFKWADAGANRINVKWVVKCDYSDIYDDNLGEDEEEEEELVEEAGSSLNDDGIFDYRITHNELHILIGPHDTEKPIYHTGVPGNFEEEKQRWEKYTAEFNPFMKGRQVWMTDGANWHKTPFSIEQPLEKPWWKFW